MFLRPVRTSQPQGPARIDWGNPITRGLFAASTGSGDGFGFAKVSGASQKATVSGLALVAPGSAGYASALAKPVSSNQWTLFAKVSQPSASGFTSAFGIYGGATSRIAIMFRAFSTANFGADARPYASDYNSGTALAAQREYVLAVLISDARDTIELFVDGVLASSAAKFTRDSISVSQLEFFVKNLTSDSATAGATLGVFGAFSRELTLREVKSLSDNPWQIFAPDSKALWIPAAASVSLPTLVQPTSTTSAGAWTATGAATLHDAINELVPSDTQYISVNSASTTELVLAESAFPGAANQTLAYRASSTQGSTLTVTLKQGATQIMTRTHALTGTDTLYTQTLSAGEIALITAGAISVTLTTS